MGLIKDKKNKIESLPIEDCDNMFDYATSIAESVSLFIDREMTGKDLIDIAYYKKTKEWLKRNFRNCGVERTRKYLSRRLKETKVYRS